MTKKCIICNQELKTTICKGKIKNMSVNFCNNHSGYCENCETIICTPVKTRQQTLNIFV